MPRTGSAAAPPSLHRRRRFATKSPLPDPSITPKSAQSRTYHLPTRRPCRTDTPHCKFVPLFLPATAITLAASVGTRSSLRRLQTVEISFLAPSWASNPAIRVARLVRTQGYANRFPLAPTHFQITSCFSARCRPAPRRWAWPFARRSPGRTSAGRNGGDSRSPTRNCQSATSENSRAPARHRRWRA